MLDDCLLLVILGMLKLDSRLISWDCAFGVKLRCCRFWDIFFVTLSASMFWNSARILILLSDASKIRLLSNSKEPLKPTFLLWLKSTYLMLKFFSDCLLSSSWRFISHFRAILSCVKVRSDLHPILHPFLFSKAARASALLTDGLKALLKSMVCLSTMMCFIDASRGVLALPYSLLSSTIVSLFKLLRCYWGLTCDDKVLTLLLLTRGASKCSNSPVLTQHT